MQQPRSQLAPAETSLVPVEQAAARSSFRYAVAVFLVVLSYVFTSALLTPLAGGHALFFLAAVCAASIVAGTGPGLLAVGLGTIGYVQLTHRRVPSFWSSGEYDTLRILLFLLTGSVMALAIGGLRRSWEASRRMRREAELFAAEQAIAARVGLRALEAPDADALVVEALDAVRSALRCESAAMLSAADGDRLEVRCTSGACPARRGDVIPVAGTVQGAALESAQPAVLRSGLRDPWAEALGYASAAAVPVRPGGGSGRPWGVLSVQTQRPLRFGIPELGLLHASAQAVGLARIRLDLERRAREHLDLLRAVTGNLAEGVYAVDREGRLTFMNPAAARMLGWTERELLGRRIHDVIHARRADGSELPEADCRLQSVLHLGVPVQGLDETFTRRDGTTFPVAFTAAPIVEEGATVGAALAFQDFTEHVRAERGDRFLAAASQRLALSLDWEETVARVARLAVPFLGDWCTVVVLDREGRARVVAAEVEDPERRRAAQALMDSYPIDLAAEHGVGRVLRTGEPELLGETSPESFVIDREAAAARRRSLISALGMTSYMAVPLVHAGRVLGAMAFGTSAPPRRLGPEDLAIAQELGRRCAVALDNARLYREAQEATRTREEVLAIVSHDLQTPLAAVRLGVGLLRRVVKRGSREEDVARVATTIDHATERLTTLVQDLVDFARMERGKLSVKLQPEDPVGILAEAQELLQGLADEHEVRIERRVAPGIRPVACDRNRVLQALGNLAANALKVMPNGGTLRFIAEEQDSEVVLRVADTGPGIAPEDLSHVFERFWRAKRAGYEGSGLGLTITRGIAEAHGGRIWVESEPGRGTTFSFSLPLAKTAPQAEPSGERQA